MAITGPTSRIKAIVVDPTVLNTRERFRVFLESLIFKEYSSFLPSSISSLIREERWDELVDLLRKWEWNLDIRKTDKWFSSDEFKDLCRKLEEVCISSDEIREELSPEERRMLSILRDILGLESPILVDLAKELVTIAITKQAGIISFTRHLRRWLKSLRGILILEISEKTDMLSQAKEGIKMKLKKAGWKGHIYITFLEIIPSLALKSILPSMIHWTVDFALQKMSSKFIVSVTVDGL